MLNFPISAMKCPNCRSDLSMSSGEFWCLSCDTLFPLEGNILNLLPSVQPPIPKLYDNPLFQQARLYHADLHATYYKKKSLSRWMEDQMKADLMKLVVSSSPPIVDIGCGTGSGIEFLGDSSEVLGIDSNIELLRSAQKTFPESKFICCDIIHAPFQDETFETIFSLAVLEHLFHLEQTLENLHRILKPGGRLYVLIPTEGGIAWNSARRLFAAGPNSRATRMSPKQYLEVVRIEHCNTAFAIDCAIRKFFAVEAYKDWPLRFGGLHLNLGRSYRLSPL